MGSYQHKTRNATYSTDGGVVTIIESGMGGDEVEVPAKEILAAADLVKLSNGTLTGNLEQLRLGLKAMAEGRTDGVSLRTKAEGLLDLVPEESD